MFEVEPEGLVLTEIAKGVDVRENVWSRSGFSPNASPTRFPLRKKCCLLFELALIETGVLPVGARV